MKHALYKIATALSSIFAFFRFRYHLHTARFARLNELKSLALPDVEPATLLLGRTLLDHVLQVRANPKRRELGNLLVVAPTRGGKGLLATSQLLSWEHSVIVNDIKGELFTQTAGYRSTLGKNSHAPKNQNVFVFDPTGIGHRYDPLAGKHTEDQLYSSATHLLFKPDEGDGAIFTQRATNMLTQIFLAARIENYPPLPYVRRMLRTGLTQVAERLELLDPQLATEFLDIPFSQANFTDRFLLSSWGTLTARLKPLLTETVVRCFTHCDITPRELLFSETPITIYLRWPERDLLALSPLVRLIWGSFIDELITAYDIAGGKNCKPVLLLIDEAGRTAIPNLSDHATTVVGRGISLWIAIQSLSQLDAVYGKDRAEVLRDNMETQLYYRPANEHTAEYLERCLGMHSAYAHSHTTRAHQEVSEGRSEQGVSLLTAWDVRQMHDEHIIGFHRHLPPFRATRMDWRHNPLLAKRHGLPQPSLSPLPELAESAQPTRQTNDVFTSPHVDPDKRKNIN